jgi:hypothetical protein
VRPTGLCEEISVSGGRSFLTRINLCNTYTIECTYTYSCVEPFDPLQGILAGNVRGLRGEARVRWRGLLPLLSDSQRLHRKDSYE